MRGSTVAIICVFALIASYMLAILIWIGLDGFQ